MYCRKCYRGLDIADEFHRCAKCGRAFDPAEPKSYLRRPFPPPSRIILQVISTTIVGFLAAFFVAMFQAVGASGH